MSFSITNIDGVDTVVTVVYDGNLFQAVNGHHVNFPAIATALRANPSSLEGIIPLFDVENVVRTSFSRLSDRVTVENGEVYFDGALMHGELTRQIMRFFKEGLTENLDAVVNFADKVMTNPSEHSREQLFSWLKDRDFSITKDGDIVAYKGVRADFKSLRAAPAHENVRVNDEAVTGNVPNQPGSWITMDRSKVAADPRQGCNSGLHVGTYGYAAGFGEVVVEVIVNPRDVVSVPTDCDAQKVRTCAYFVVKQIEEERTSALYEGDPFDDDEDSGEFYCDCDACSDIEGAVFVTSASWDTRLNYTKQERYPKGHPKAGQFVPKA